MVALVDGLTASEWAVTKGTSMATVRSQIKSLFEKTGAHSQAHLVGLAKTLPSLV